MATRRTGPTASFEERVGATLVAGRYINSTQLAEARETSRANDTPLLETLVSSRMLTHETLVTVLSFQLRISVVDIRHAEINPRAVRLVEEHFARSNTVLPLGFDTDGSLRVAARMPEDFRLSFVLSGMAGCQVKFVLAMGGNLAELIELIYTSGAASQQIQAIHGWHIPSEYVNPEAVCRIPKAEAQRYRVLPVGLDPDGSLVVATTRIDTALQAQLSSIAGSTIRFVLAWGGKLDEWINSVVDITNTKVDPELATRIPMGFYAPLYDVLPIRVDPDGSLVVATTVINRSGFEEEVSEAAGCKVRLVLASGGNWGGLIKQSYEAAKVQAPTSVVAPAQAARVDQDLEALLTIQAVEVVIVEALESRASEIQLVPESDAARVLFLIDGVLQQMTTAPPLTLHQSMISYIKGQAGMSIAETRRTQYGTFTMTFGELNVKFRVSCVGTPHGEMMGISITERSG